MLVAAFAALSGVVLLGMTLTVLHGRAGGGRLQARLGLLHGSLGALGLAGLAMALRHATLGALTWDALALLASALLAGGAYYLMARRGRPPGAILVLHGALGFIGYVLLAAYVGTG